MLPDLERADRIGEFWGYRVPRPRRRSLRVTNWNRRTFTPAAVIAGIVPPFLRVHDLRQTAANLMTASGACVKVVQQQLGHRAAAMTLERYAHVFLDELEALSSALDGLKARTPADSLRTVEPVADLRSRRA